jgi:hypothetical protein
VVEAIFRKDKQPQGHQQEDVPEASAQRGNKKKGKKKSQAKRDAADVDLVVAAEHRNPRKPLGGANLFDKMLKESCPYHQGPVKHTLEECVMLRRYFHKAGPTVEGGRAHNNDKKEGHKAKEFPEVHDCFMIYGGQVANASARHRKQERREVCSVKVATPVYLDWSDKPITFDQGDHPDRIPSPGKYPLVVDPIIGNVSLTKVLMDGRNNLNIIYAETLGLLQIDLSTIRAGAAAFHGIPREPKGAPFKRAHLGASRCRRSPLDLHSRNHSGGQRRDRSRETRRGACIALQRPVYFISEVLSETKIRYPQIQKLLYAVILTRRKLRHYFESHRVTVVSSFPLGEIIQCREASGRIAKLAVEIMGETISFAPRKAIKSQVLADFVAEWVDTQLPAASIQPELWTMFFDGSLMKTGVGAGLLFISPLGKHLRYALRLHFPASNNVAEYETLVNGLHIAIELGVRRLDAHGDSQLVIDQVMKNSHCRDPKMEAYCDEVRRLEDKFYGLELNHIAR